MKIFLNKKNFFKWLLLPVLLLISIEPEVNAQAQFDTGEIGVDVNVYGRVSIYTPSNAGARQIERLSILAGVGPDQVFDYQNDSGIEDSTYLVFHSPDANHEINGAYNNSFSDLPPNILQKLNVYGWNNGAYILLKNTIINSEAAPINVIIGLDIITQLNGFYGFDTVKYLFDSKVIDVYKESHIGFKLLSHESTSLTSFEWYSGYTEDSTYWSLLNHGTIDSLYESVTGGPVIIPAQAPVVLNPGDSIVIYHAVALSDSLSGMLANINEAEAKYTLLTSIDEYSNNIPVQFSLEQNYPNPFNSNTIISWQLAAGSFVTLKVYDVLGNEVAKLINEEKPAGKYEVKFDASNLSSGRQGLSSGIYFYTLTAGKFFKTKKMLLLK